MTEQGATMPTDLPVTHAEIKALREANPLVEWAIGASRRLTRTKRMTNDGSDHRVGEHFHTILHDMVRERRGGRMPEFRACDVQPTKLVLERHFTPEQVEDFKDAFDKWQRTFPAVSALETVKQEPDYVVSAVCGALRDFAPDVFDLFDYLGEDDPDWLDQVAELYTKRLENGR